MFEPFFADSIVRLASDGNLMLAAWLNAPTMPQMNKMWELNLVLRGKFPRVGYLGLILSGVPNFSNDVRQEAARQSSVSEQDLATAHVVLVSGIVGAAARTFLTTVTLIARPKQPTKVFGELEAAVRWIEPILNQPGLPSHTHDSLHAACAALQRET